MLIIADEYPDDEEALAQMKEAFPTMSDEHAMSGLQEAREWNKEHAEPDNPSENNQMRQNEQENPSFPDAVNASPEELMSQGKNDKLVSATGKLPGQEPYNPDDDPNPLDLGMDKLKESQEQE